MVHTLIQASAFKVAASSLVFALLLVQGNAHAAPAVTQYTYDPDGRITTAVYDTGLCLIYTYDENGNRLTQSGKSITPSQGFVWGDGVWGCAPWTAG